MSRRFDWAATQLTHTTPRNGFNIETNGQHKMPKKNKEQIQSEAKQEIHLIKTDRGDNRVLVYK